MKAPGELDGMPVTVFSAAHPSSSHKRPYIERALQVLAATLTVFVFYRVLLKLCWHFHLKVRSGYRLLLVSSVNIEIKVEYVSCFLAQY